MGLGSYRASDWTRLRSSKGLTQVNRVEKVFTVSSAAGKYDVRNIRVRESRDSDDSPRSTPVIIGFDVTASMGYLAKELAVNAINKTVTDLCRNKPITNPHVMCAAIGDCKSDKSPLQVTQFEADIRIERNVFIGVQKALDLYRRVLQSALVLRSLSHLGGLL